MTPLRRGYFEELLHTITRAKHGHQRKPTLGRNFSSRPDLIEEAQSSVPLLHESTRIKPRTGYRYPQHLLASLYALGSKPPLSSYSALAHRMNLPASLKDDLGLIEQCCTCPSFWEAVHENDEELRHVLPKDRRLTYFQDARKKHNQTLSSVGNEILGMLASEWISHRWPHLPVNVTKAAVTMYVGPNTCSDVARRWGIQPGIATTQNFSESEDPAKWETRAPVGNQGKSSRGVGEGRRAGVGVLRWARKENVQVQAKTDSTSEGRSFEDAMACTARAFVGALYQRAGFEATRQFVRSHFFSRQADIASILKFEDPKAILSATTRKYQLGHPEARLLKESGRASMSPLFVVGIFTSHDSARPNYKLGEGLGSSIKMAEFRASEDALRRIYLAKGNAEGVPSDTLAGLEWDSEAAIVGDDEVVLKSSGKSGKLAESWQKEAWSERERVSGMLA